jgi:hypothetical protein
MQENNNQFNVSETWINSCENTLISGCLINNTENIKAQDRGREIRMIKKIT